MDDQKQRLYDAEKLVQRVLDSVASNDQPTFDFYGSTLNIPLDRKFGDLEAVQRYVDAVLALNWVRATWPDRVKWPVRVVARRGNRWAEYVRLYSEMRVPPREKGGEWALREFVILHEITHHLAPRGEQHGPVFAGIFLRLVTEIIGPEAGLLLTDSFTKHGVQFRHIATT